MSSFDFESLTLEEVEVLENLTGESIDQAFSNGKPKGKALKSFVWIVMKRDNPKFTIEEASKFTLSQALALVQGDEEKKE
ncbi:hypothetical protein UFOVP541_19 [uncultured Caudovirales phage]|uniref:Uncharacterized protein n=1 Tax=uncultured Caudovirales phage TaxID=2100421 RepID=A0A6J5MSH9_9CAUD|nr:hypothetical protein UFOVP541_19 [uncultured Caudovirales phage]